MPPMTPKQLEQLALSLGFYRSRQESSHVRWKHLDGRATTIPTYSEIGDWLLDEILRQLGVTKKDLRAKNSLNASVCQSNKMR